MSYSNGNYNGVVRVGTVKWSNDYKHVMKFNNKTARNTFITENLTLLSNKISFVANPNGFIDILGSVENVENLNYLCYKNSSDISNGWFCCFITHYEMIAANTARLYLELDIFQQYFYDTIFFQSYIERAIVSPAENTSNKNYLPEPVSASLDYEDKIQDILASEKWDPLWVLHMASYYNSSTHEYDYKGIGTNNTYGEYGRFIESQNEIDAVLSQYGRKSAETIAKDVGIASGNTTWKDWINSIFAGTAGTDVIEAVKSTTSAADLQDHRQELIGLYAIPLWLKEAYISDGGNANFADNRRVYKDISLSINSGTLANGYTPRNKKLLTSVCRGYVLANKTGMKKTFKPELFTGAPTLRIAGITMSTSGYQWHITNYKDITDSYDEVAYNSERRVGYDANTGLNKVINTISAGASAAVNTGALLSGVQTANPTAAISGFGGAVSSAVSAVDQIGQKEQHFGHNGDLLRITGGRAQLSWYEVSPTSSECAAIDNFFDMYGYTINQHKNPTSYFNSRSNWNYVKCDNNVNLTCPCSANNEQKMKNIFINGVTLWHTYQYFGDYSRTNN